MRGYYAAKMSMFDSAYSDLAMIGLPEDNAKKGGTQAPFIFEDTAYFKEQISVIETVPLGLKNIGLILYMYRSLRALNPRFRRFYGIVDYLVHRGFTHRTNTIGV